MDDRDALLPLDRRAGRGFLERLPDRPVSQAVNLPELRDALGGPLPVSGEDPLAVIEALARRVEPGLVGSAGAALLRVRRGRRGAGRPGG